MEALPHSTCIQRRSCRVLKEHCRRIIQQMDIYGLEHWQLKMESIPMQVLPRFELNKVNCWRACRSIAPPDHRLDIRPHSKSSTKKRLERRQSTWQVLIWLWRVRKPVQNSTLPHFACPKALSLHCHAIIQVVTRIRQTISLFNLISSEWLCIFFESMCILTKKKSERCVQNRFRTRVTSVSNMS